MEIAVLGGGNGSAAAAADLAEHGHAVRWWRRDGRAFAPVLARQALALSDGRGTRAVRLALATTDLGQAVRGAAVIVAPLPAFAQMEMARALAPHLSADQVIYLPPGTFGAYAMAQAFAEPRPILAETGTLPYLTRKKAEDHVAIMVRATRLPTGFFPARRDGEGRAVLRQVYPAIEPCPDVLAAALLNAGPIIHPPLILMNAGPLEHGGSWDIHKEGTQPSVRRVSDVLDAERVAVREALGYGPPHYPLADHYRGEGEEWMYGRQAHDKLVDSDAWREVIDLAVHRYMREDVAMGLAFLVSAARHAGVAAPLAEALLTLASAAIGEDLAQGPRTLAGLGLAGRDPAGLKRLLFDGDDSSYS